jgi:uncharacterized membrane protein
VTAAAVRTQAAGAPSSAPVRPRPRHSATGLGLAALCFCLSLTPSLLPRPWLLQGLIGGILAAGGYGLGAAAGYLSRSLVRQEPPARVRRVAWGLLVAASGIALLASLGRGFAWQTEMALLVGTEPPGRAWPVASLGAAGLVLLAVVAAVRALRSVARQLGRFLGRWILPRLARAAGGLVVVLVVIVLLDGVVHDTASALADRSFRALNDQLSPDREPPSSRTLSGGPGSLVTWSSLGRWGRDFVSGGPTVDDLERFSGAPASTPVRVYVGLGSRESLHDEAALAVAELQRTGAFTRRVLVVVTTTGTGWVNSQTVDAIEYMYNGDSALVGLQYSYLPSWLSFLVDQESAAEAGRQLFNAVYTVWSQLPEAGRPQLFVVGESLGSFGSEAAFGGVEELFNRTDGALWVGPMNFNRLWRELTAAREPGSPEILPVYERGRTVRFGAWGRDLDQPPTVWEHPRVVYLQQASDPVVWWSPRLLLRRPDWLREPLGRDVHPRMTWYPFVTFWQVAADMVRAADTPPEYGHNYGGKPVEAWARIAPPPGWTEDDTSRLKTLIEANGRR